MTSLLDLPDACHPLVLLHLPVQVLLHLGMACKGLSRVVSDPLVWHQLAVHKWGAHVPEAVPNENWMGWCRKRMSIRSIRPSPHNLIQESYPDPWQHITACVLCSRTSGSEIIRHVIAYFFDRFPSPSSVMDAPEEELVSIIHPLGLQPNRLRAVQAIASGFLQTDWTQPSEFWGCGKFVDDSWRIFCKGDISGKGVEDLALKSYVSWASKVHKEEVSKAPKQEPSKVEEDIAAPVRSRSKAAPRGKADGPPAKKRKVGAEQQQQLSGRVTRALVRSGTSQPAPARRAQQGQQEATQGAGASRVAGRSRGRHQALAATPAQRGGGVVAGRHTRSMAAATHEALVAL